MPTENKQGFLRASVVYFGILFGTGFALGFVRVPVLVPRLGERTAELLEAPLMAAAIFFASRFIVKRYLTSVDLLSTFLVGLFALGHLLAAEMAVLLLLRGLSLREYLDARDPVAGTVYLLLLALSTLAPTLHQIAIRRSR